MAWHLALPHVALDPQVPRRRHRLSSRHVVQSVDEGKSVDMRRRRERDAGERRTHASSSVSCSSSRRLRLESDYSCRHQLLLSLEVMCVLPPIAMAASQNGLSSWIEMSSRLFFSYKLHEFMGRVPRLAQQRRVSRLKTCVVSS